ncbi:MAG TPA: UbiA-like polyprenyltransferase [Salinivirga sp.]|uniref:UbiA-like polyprenyltransferase n=1 Tax=Salinivirga sp. TaxID=1970192 RepID=UPI002B466B71|nr:UbiA-like polyprenyltransferase [Salinivirga sp.]HKK58832.1 UbiA-like polyprenyltransferase [Salinivirga sp.]
MQKFLSLVKFAHTVFAMPFALVGYFMAAVYFDGGFNWLDLLKVLLAMVFARNAAMGFNRYIDRNIDAQNVRTASREIPSGAVSVQAAGWFVIINVLAFIITTWFINLLCFYLSFVAIAVVLGYSLTKRFTWLCHFILGLGLSLAPIGAFLAVTGTFHLVPVMLSVAVLLWVTGFDIIYALQDDNFDKAQGLFSIPSYFGRKNALWISRAIHLFSGVIIILIGTWLNLTYIYFIGAGIFVLLLLYQHLIVKVSDLSKVNLAFFTTNGIASILYAAITIFSFFII